MTEQIYNQLVEGELDRIYNTVSEQFGDDIDIEKGDGILKIILEDDTKLIISRQAPVKQLWLAAPTGGYHYYYDEDLKGWYDTKTKNELLETITGQIKAGEE